jgi:hypothetical protein
MKAGQPVNVKFFKRIRDWRLGVSTKRVVTAGTVSAMILLGFNALLASPSSAVGTLTNAITASGQPLAGSTGGHYVTQATATSKDVVVVALASGSTGCSVSGATVSFTGAGECVITFNDPGNATYGPAPQITENITVDAANVITVTDPKTEGGVDGVYEPVVTATSGDTVTRALAASSTGCTLKAEKVTFEKQGTCVIIFSDPSTGAFAAATPVTEKLTIYAVNFIHTSVSPKTATVGETYAASASASSKDPVVITIDNKSLGCGITNQLVTFTQNGNCIVDFNDTGNGVYGPAKQVQQIIVVGKGGLRSQASFYLTSLNGIDHKTLTLTSGGGSGTGPVTYVTTPGSANCSIVGDVLSYSRVGVCVVTATKAGDPTYNLMRALPAHVVINVAGSPRASHVGTAVWSGRSLSTTIVGTGFYGIPKVASSVRSTKVVVTHDSGNVLAIHASFVKNTQSGVHTLTITFAHGQRTLVLYKQS